MRCAPGGSPHCHTLPCTGKTRTHACCTLAHHTPPRYTHHDNAPAAVPRRQLVAGDAEVQEHDQLVARSPEALDERAHAALLVVEVIQQPALAGAQEGAQRARRVKHDQPRALRRGLVVQRQVHGAEQVLVLRVGAAGVGACAAEAAAARCGRSVVARGQQRVSARPLRAGGGAAQAAGPAAVMPSGTNTSKATLWQGWRHWCAPARTHTRAQITSVRGACLVLLPPWHLCGTAIGCPTPLTAACTRPLQPRKPPWAPLTTATAVQA
jgi:hypothetical protein